MKGKSAVWDYFEVDKNNNSELKCKVSGCEAIVSRGSINPQFSNTTNAWAHLRKNHLEVFNQVQEKKENDAKGTNNNDKQVLIDFFQRKLL